MARYEVRVVIDIDQRSAVDARAVVEDRLRQSGIEQWRLAGVQPFGVKRRARPVRRRVAVRDEVVGGSFLVGAVIFWWLWFWIMSM